jgi:hydrogenase nickel incorporation protein HypA/HybF
MDIVLDQAKSAEAKKVTKINLVIGEMSGVVELRCRDCQIVFQPNDSAWVCPNCGSTSQEVIRGQESYVESIEIEQ